MSKRIVTVLSIRPGSELLKTEPYWGDPKGNTFYPQQRIDMIHAKLSKLTFPCKMTDTGEKSLFGGRIIKDEFGEKWAESHFFTEDLPGG